MDQAHLAYNLGKQDSKLVLITDLDFVYQRIKDCYSIQMLISYCQVYSYFTNFPVQVTVIAALVRAYPRMEVDFAFIFIIANTIAMEEFIVSFAVIIASTKEAVLAFTFKSITIVILVAIIVTIFIIKLALTSFIN